jgi:hypothetical protein
MYLTTLFDMHETVYHSSHLVRLTHLMENLCKRVWVFTVRPIHAQYLFSECLAWLQVGKFQVMVVFFLQGRTWFR